MAKSMYFPGFLVARFRFFFLINRQIPLLGSARSKKFEGFLRKFTFISGL